MLLHMEQSWALRTNLQFLQVWLAEPHWRHPQGLLPPDFMRGEKHFFSPHIGPVRWASWGTGDCEASALGDSHPGRQVRVWCQVGDGWQVKREVVVASLSATRSSCVRSAATV
jgi:hypothetical protein